MPILIKKTTLICVFQGFTGNKLSELTDKIKGKEAEIVQLKEELSAVSKLLLYLDQIIAR